MPAALEIGAGLALERPLGLAAFALPLFVWLLHRRRAHPELRATGTLAIWREVFASRTPRGARARRAVPPRLWIALAALGFGALALAGPRPAGPPEVRTWRVLVDRSPSMYLPWNGESAAPTRLARALAELEPWLRAHVLADDHITWLRAGLAGLEKQEGARMPAEWLAPPRLAELEPEWAHFDAPGTIWLTDREPPIERAAAGLAASGGDLAPGCVGRVRDQRVDWDGTRISAVPNALPPATYALAGTGALAAEIENIVSLWAEDRGLVAPGTAGAEIELAVHGPPAGDRRDLTGARDGWSARGRVASAGAPPSDELGPLALWLAADDGLALVTAGSGRVHVAFESLESIEGDPAAFAVSWAALLDAHRSPPPGAVSVAERAAAGAAVLAPPSAPPPDEAIEGARFHVDALLALLAGLLALWVAMAR